MKKIPEIENPLLKMCKNYALKQDIFKWFLESALYLEVPQFVPKTHLRGTDNRTIDKWLNDLEKYGCIKKSFNVKI